MIEDMNEFTPGDAPNDASISGGVVDYSKKFTIFTDGSALNNRAEAPAGMAVYFPSVKVLRSKSMIGTNNQAELEAMRYALWYFMEQHKKWTVPDNTIYVFSDSEYVINSIQNKWKAKENMAKIRICQKLIKLIKTTGFELRFIHVKAHTKKKDFISLNNDIVDQEARRCATEIRDSNVKQDSEI